jgi:Na+/proline symporter
MVRTSKSRKRLSRILSSIIGGVAGGVVLWLLNFITWFHEYEFSWWNPVVFGSILAVIFYLIIFPINEKETAKYERKQREKM